ncbi:putative membrane protein [Halapricum desulfuricans]|uniref:Putative membrane protein n=1 Tax=Halapricum desulfuricans TaxID=2841257 RepID=A0A897N000_9EURY|nr:putative membrane protein [Halapricum desulfuricans]
MLASAVALTQVPVVAAHETTATGGITSGHGVALALVGILVLVGSALLKRTGRSRPTLALYGVFVGLSLTVLGTVLFEGLSPDPTYTARSMPFPRAWYQPLALSVGTAVAVGSVLVGRLRWPTRPRYALLGVLMGLWIAYPYLIPGSSDSHPLGYAIVLATPVAVAYVLWADAGDAFRAVLRDRVARRFGIGTAVVLLVFFFGVTGYLSFFPEEGAPHEVTVAVLPTIYQLVTWPTLEIALPHIPLFLAVSPGQLLILGTLSALIGLNGALIARQWRAEQRAGFTEGTAGSAAVVGTCTCGCCGPLVAKIAGLAAGPAIAAPLYWLFVDPMSPLSALFVVGSLLLFAGSIVYSVSAVRNVDTSVTVSPSD